MTKCYLYPDAIVSGPDLESLLGRPDLRICDCTFYLDYEEGTGRPYSVRSGYADWAQAHIPGSVHLDLQRDFSAQDAATSFMHLSADATADAFAAHGIGDGTQVVLYSRGSPNRATRFWWMLRWIGFDGAAILDGGMDLWLAQGRPVDSTDTRYPRASLNAEVRPGLWADKGGVLSAIGNGAICALNALDPDLHSGANARYGRAGRIPGSTNVPASALVEPETGLLVAPDVAAAAFRDAGATPEKRIVNYCGGGIAATLDAFLQHQLGYEDIAVYDASMSEWAMDPDLPIERD